MKNDYSTIIQYIGKQDWHRAISEISLCLSQNEMDEELAILAATVFIGTGNYDKARNVIAKGFCINKRNCELWLLLGQTYETTNVNQAYLCYENALFYAGNENDKAIIKEFVKSSKGASDFKVKKVSIVILSYNTLDYTKECIESIKKTCPKFAYEIIVVDNASYDGSVEWLNQQDDIKLLCNKENVGFPKGCNQGIALSEKDNDIFLLNNDTVLSDDALFWLRMGLYDADDVGESGAMSNSVSNSQKVLWDISSKEDWQECVSVVPTIFNYPFADRNWLVGFAVLLKRTVLDEIGLLDETFSPGQYEDNDLSFRLTQSGYRCLLCKNSYIYHYGSAGGKHSSTWNELTSINSKKFANKWGVLLTQSFLLPVWIPNMFFLNQLGNVKILVVGAGIGYSILVLKQFNPLAEIEGIEFEDRNLGLVPKNCVVHKMDDDGACKSIETNKYNYIIVDDRAIDRFGFSCINELYKKLLVPDGEFIYNKDKVKIL